MIDSHTHLDHLPIAVDEAVGAALEAGVRRLLTIGTGVACWPAARGAPGRHHAGWAAGGVEAHTPRD